MSTTSYSRHLPFLSKILSRFSLTKAGSTKRVDHVELCLKDSGIVYKPGDSIGVYPLNPVDEVRKILHVLGASGEELVAQRSGANSSLMEFLLRQANLQTCSKALFKLGLEKHPHSTLQRHHELLKEDTQADLKAFLSLYHVSDFLEQFCLNQFSPQELVSHLSPMLPRFYSIASAMQTVGETAHLAVSLTSYEIQGLPRYGIASHYLCCSAPLQEQTIPIYLQPTKEFTLPSDKERSMIMIGAGTGVAPYRGFLQQRLDARATGKHWLIFGERHRHTDFLYESDWQRLTEQNALQLSLAFSRDSEQKRYVQHLIMEEGKQLYRWIEEGAYIYVCGDAACMAKEVEKALLHVFKEHGGCTDAESVGRLQQLRKDKRYLRDVY